MRAPFLKFPHFREKRTCKHSKHTIGTTCQSAIQPIHQYYFILNSFQTMDGPSAILPNALATHDHVTPPTSSIDPLPSSTVHVALPPRHLFFHPRSHALHQLTHCHTRYTHHMSITHINLSLTRFITFRSAFFLNA